MLKVKFVMDESTTLADLLELNLHDCEEEVKNIVDKAVKEMSMERYMKELNVIWSKMEFEKEIHARTGATLIRASEELIETLEENQVHFPQRRIHSFYIDTFSLSPYRSSCKILSPRSSSPIFWKRCPVGRGS